ncbi:MAG: imidazole glycerol phosphate synthase subunit HisH [Spirochaetaceae bacterium]|jgi:imidazole glycerol phosphate synthase glutamine amidotransferase subunit|nr:imidazole glycerol phosphate synthase subunit HisH [Spirochaetaceae bacterium]
MLVGVLNYGAGNLGSVMNALSRLGVGARFVEGPGELDPAASPFDGMVFPGDGHFASAMNALRAAGYAGALKGWIEAGRPFLGICIGMQVLFEASEEAPGVKGLGVIRGAVKRFPGRKVPQIGWNETAAQEGSRLFRGCRGSRQSNGANDAITSNDNAFFYYIHSYYCAPLDSAGVAAVTDYYLPYCSAFERGNLAAVQFHPEKSGEAGLRLLRNWAETVPVPERERETVPEMVPEMLR